MANNYLTPGVYVQEISALPGVVVEVQSAVPAFIGYTERTRYDGRDLKGVPEPISSFKDFEARFGGAASLELDAVHIRTDDKKRFQSVESVSFQKRFFLYQAVYTYFQNGGGSCFVVSTGAYESLTSAKDKDIFLAALESLEAVDDVTLLVMPEAVFLGDSLPAVQQAALAQCAKRMNRFAILDIAEIAKDKSILLNWSHSPDADSWKKSCQSFRDRIGIMNLSYGAAYTPYIIADVKAEIDYEKFNTRLFKADGTTAVNLSLAELDPAAKASIDSLETAIKDRDKLAEAITRYSEALSEKQKAAIAKKQVEALDKAVYEAIAEVCAQDFQDEVVKKAWGPFAAAFYSLITAVVPEEVSPLDEAILWEVMLGVMQADGSPPALNADILTTLGINVLAAGRISVEGDPKDVVSPKATVIMESPPTAKEFDAKQTLGILSAAAILGFPEGAARNSNEEIKNAIVKQKTIDFQHEETLAEIVKAVVYKEQNATPPATGLAPQILAYLTGSQTSQVAAPAAATPAGTAGHRLSQDIIQYVYDHLKNFLTVHLEDFNLPPAKKRTLQEAVKLEQLLSAFQEAFLLLGDEARVNAMALLERFLQDDLYSGINKNIQRLSEGLASNSAVYRATASAIQTAMQVQPPSAAMAGIYAAVDRQRGVWKAPANVSLSGVKGLTQVITAGMQESLNSDSVAGKSINALRAFPGQGNLVWGARTLDGNSLEWRYIPVRRFFITVEESIRRATTWAVFEPNDATLWSKLKAMIDNYLLQKWKDGALQGASPAEAFFVAVGLGSTMTEQDILEGRLIIDIGMAVVRPAEFIILRFMHKMQQS